MQGFFTFGVI